MHVSARPAHGCLVDFGGPAVFEGLENLKAIFDINTAIDHIVTKWVAVLQQRCQPAGKWASIMIAAMQKH